MLLSAQLPKASDVLRQEGAVGGSCLELNTCIYIHTYVHSYIRTGNPSSPHGREGETVQEIEGRNCLMAFPMVKIAWFCSEISLQSLLLCIPLSQPPCREGFILSTKTVLRKRPETEPIASLQSSPNIPNCSFITLFHNNVFTVWSPLSDCEYLKDKDQASFIFVDFIDSKQSINACCLYE